MLASLGFSDKNGDGILEDREGHPLEFNLLTNTGNTTRISLCNIIVDDLKQVGVKCTFTPVEFNALVTKLDSTFDWEAIMLGNGSGPEPYGSKSLWTSTGKLHSWNPRQAKPATAWEAEIDQIFSQAAKTVDPDKRKLLYNRWQEIAAEQMPQIFLVTQDSLAVVRNRLKNTQPTSLGVLWNEEEVYIQ
jgi:peptide/nickel transport system substrate-binding protein